MGNQCCFTPDALALTPRVMGAAGEGHVRTLKKACVYSKGAWWVDVMGGPEGGCGELVS